MSKRDKLSDRFQSIPGDFTWEELVAVLGYYGYKEISAGKTSGSRRRFSDKDQNLIRIHKPHPQNVVEKYALREVLQSLIDRGQVKDE